MGSFTFLFIFLRLINKTLKSEKKTTNNKPNLTQPLLLFLSYFFVSVPVLNDLIPRVCMNVDEKGACDRGVIPFHYINL